MAKKQPMAVKNGAAPMAGAAEMAEVGVTPAAPANGETMPVLQLAYARSPGVQHSWLGKKRVNVSFCLSYSALAGQAELAADCVTANWSEAEQRARVICENSDLFDEEGRIACEEMLCQELTNMLFKNGDEAAIGSVERVIWDQITWR